MRLGMLYVFFIITLLSLNSGVGAEAKTFKITIIGDSLTAGYGVSREQAYPLLLEKKLNEEWQSRGVHIQVINGGMSGDTSAGGLRRMNWMLKSEPQLVVIGLGANDMLRGLKPSVTLQNLSRMIEQLQEKKICVGLLGMKALPHYGREYEREFNGVYSQLAKKYKVALRDFFIERVAAKPELNLRDGIHPNADGHQVLADGLFDFFNQNISECRGRS